MLIILQKRVSCFSRLLFFFFFVLKFFFRNCIRLSNSLDPDQARRSVGPDLGPNCLQNLSAYDEPEGGGGAPPLEIISSIGLRNWTPAPPPPPGKSQTPFPCKMLDPSGILETYFGFFFCQLDPPPPPPFEENAWICACSADNKVATSKEGFFNGSVPR